MRLLLLTMLALAPAVAVAEDGPGLETRQDQAEADRLRENMRKRAQKAAWKGVEALYQQLDAMDVPLESADYVLGAQAARMQGDSWNAYQRCAVAVQQDEELTELDALMKVFRTGYGRLTVRRVEATPIELLPAEAPFTPDARSSITFAQERLRETGGFDGLLPIGAYTLGEHSFDITNTLKPVVVQRVAGDGTGKKKKR